MYVSTHYKLECKSQKSDMGPKTPLTKLETCHVDVQREVEFHPDYVTLHKVLWLLQVLVKKPLPTKKTQIWFDAEPLAFRCPNILTVF